MNQAKNETLQYSGRYVIHMERKGKAIVYDVLTQSGMLARSGFDCLSRNEKTALEGIVRRLYGETEKAAAASSAGGIP